MSAAPLLATVDISDAVSPRLRAAVLKLSDRTELHRSMAMAVEGKVSENFETKPPNKLGGTSTRYWMKAAASARVSADSQAGTISIPHRGIRLHYLGSQDALGGPVKPTNKSWLTIPASPEAHGHRAYEVAGGYANQKWLFGKDKKPYAIADKATGEHIYFWLKKQVTIPKDPTVLPPAQVMKTAAGMAASDYINAEVAS